MTGLAFEDDSIRDFTSQISLQLGSPNHTGSFGEVYRRTINLKSGEGETEVAVKVFKIDPRKGTDKTHKGISRELNVWLRLKRPTVVPLLGIAYVDPPFPALISQWMSSGALYAYLENQAAIPTFARSVLIKGVADGLHYLHSENVVHGDLHPGNVLIDDFGNPRLTDFGLATVVEDPELQWSTITLGHNFDPRWRAPEVLGIKDDPERPTFKSDIYSFGSVMFFIVSGNIPWKEKRQPQICVELATGVTPARLDNIRDDHWNLIQNCWAWDPKDRPWSKKVLDIITNISGLPLPVDLTGQIFGTINDHVASGALGNVYRFEWRRPTGPVKVAVKVFKFHASEEDLRRIRQEVTIWARLVHENIVSFLGTTQGFGSSPALVSLWFPHGTLLRLIADKGGSLNIRSKLNLLRDIASGLHYLHCFPIVHGDLTSSNILVDIKGGEYKACLTDFGLSTVLGGLLGDCTIEGSTVRYGAVRWTAPELLRLAFDHPPGAIPTKQSDIYSFGRVMFHILTLLIPWDGLDDLLVFKKILGGEEIMRPKIPHATPDITDARWNKIEWCWSVDAPRRPSALMIMDFLTRELGALIVVFGQIGDGKSSVVNLLAGEEKANTSPDMGRCTMCWKEYFMTFDGRSYKVFDTIGLQHPWLGIEEYLEAIANARNLITRLENEGGIDLLLFCVRAGRITGVIQNNYRLFYEWLCEKKVPIVLVVTGLESEERMEDWWTRQSQALVKYEIFVDGHACITAANKLSGRAQEMYEDSRRLMRRLVREHTHDRLERCNGSDGRKGGDGWFRKVIQGPRELLQGDRSVGKKDIMDILTQRCGMPPYAAAKLAREFRKTGR